MTEREWLECTDTFTILAFLLGKVSERKLRLFAVACCRSTIAFIRRSSPADSTIVTGDEKAWHAIRVAESFADGNLQTSQNDLETAYIFTDKSFQYHSRLEDALRSTASSSAAGAAHETLRFLNLFIGDELGLDEDEAPNCEIPLLRDIFGNPFRPIAFDSSWLTPTVKAITTSIYDERAFDRMPILADALEETGCTLEEVLRHCRNGGEHCKGCWVIDQVLGKE